MSIPLTDPKGMGQSIAGNEPPTLNETMRRVSGNLAAKVFRHRCVPLIGDLGR
jgi:hypothetical protein